MESAWRDLNLSYLEGVFELRMPQEVDHTRERKSTCARDRIVVVSAVRVTESIEARQKRSVTTRVLVSVDERTEPTRVVWRSAKTHPHRCPESHRDR